MDELSKHLSKTSAAVYGKPNLMNEFEEIHKATLRSDTIEFRGGNLYDVGGNPHHFYLDPQRIALDALEQAGQEHHFADVQHVKAKGVAGAARLEVGMLLQRGLDQP